MEHEGSLEFDKPIWGSYSSVPLNIGVSPVLCRGRPWRDEPKITSTLEVGHQWIKKFMKTAMGLSACGRGNISPRFILPGQIWWQTQTFIIKLQNQTGGFKKYFCLLKVLISLIGLSAALCSAGEFASVLKHSEFLVWTVKAEPATFQVLTQHAKSG